MYGKRISILFAGMTAGFLLLLCRLAVLMNPAGGAAAQAAARQQTRSLTIAEVRGTIYDRSGNPLTNAQNIRRALVLPALAEDPQALCRELEGKLDIDPEKLMRNTAEGRAFVADITAEGIVPSEAVQIFSVPIDREPHEAHHILGDINGEGEGISGIARSYDALLREETALLRCTVPVDAAMRQLPGLSYRIDYGNYGKKSGVQLTLDSGIQHIAEQAAQKMESGAVLVSGAITGELLASVSRPDYDASALADYLDSDSGELVNRALQPYNIGSIFKLVVLAAYMETYGALPDMRVECTGSIRVGDRDFACHKQGGHGEVDVTEAMAASCNVYFIRLAGQIGLNRILDIAERLGIGERHMLAPGLSSARGSLPARDTDPLPGVVANTAIGQGDVMLTPLDVAYLMNAIANGGSTRSIQLVQSVIRSGKESKVERPKEKQVFSPKTAQLLRDVMVATVEEGTGRTAKPESGGAGGKTATAETGWKKDGAAVTQAWFAGFYPADDPRYTITVLVEGGTSGGGAAGPIFREIADGIAALEKD